MGQNGPVSSAVALVRLTILSFSSVDWAVALVRSTILSFSSVDYF